MTSLRRNEHRHLHNILIDVKRGEIIHIDLGIAFEQGKTLPIPETVPFRLTRDLVDGMGVLGVEGVFRKCCEVTLALLRTERTNVHAILDVLRHDPLYSWTLSSSRTHRPMRDTRAGSSESENSEVIPKANITPDATRAILQVERKLLQDTSLQADITALINSARDLENLALLFAGWSAWY